MDVFWIYFGLVIWVFKLICQDLNHVFRVFKIIRRPSCWQTLTSSRVCFHVDTGWGNTCIVPYNCDWTSTVSNGRDHGGFELQAKILRRGHDNLQWRHDWTGHVRSRCGSLLSVPYGTPSPINATHSQWYCFSYFLPEAHWKKKKRRRMV